MRRNLLNQLIHVIHDINMMMMMSLYHLMNLLGDTHDVKDLHKRLYHFSSIHSQILKLFLHVVEEEVTDVVKKDVYCHVCSDKIL